MTTRRRSTPRTTRSTRRRRSGTTFHMPVFDDEIIRSLVGIALLIVGVVTLIGLALPSQGKLTDWWRDSIAPWFGSLRLLLPFVLLACGVWLEWRRPKTGWRRRLVATFVAYACLMGIVGLLADAGVLEGKSGGRIGTFLADVLPALITVPGTFLVLTLVGIAALALALDRPLRALFAGPLSGAKDVGVALLGDRPEPVAVGPGKPAPAFDHGDARRTGGVAREGRRSRSRRHPARPGAWGDADAAIPSPVPSAGQNSATFAPARATGAAASATLVAPVKPLRDLDDVTDGTDAPPTRERIAYVLPPVPLLDDVAVPIAAGGDDAVHARNEEIIVKKLAGFGIPAKIIGRNAGPVVTQYEVMPAPDVKVSRIEGLSDDLAMALAATDPADRGPDPGQERGRHRDPEQGLQHRRPAAHPRGGRLQGLGLDADLRARSGRGGQGPGGRPRQDAPPARSPGPPARARA